MDCKKDGCWIADGTKLTLHAGRKIRAEADAFLNIGVIRTPRGWFRSDGETRIIVDVAKVIVAQVERKLGFGELPIIDARGSALPEVRQAMEEHARGFENFYHRPSNDPPGEAKQSIDLAFDALNEAARDGGTPARAVRRPEPTALRRVANSSRD